MVFLRLDAGPDDADAAGADLMGCEVLPKTLAVRQPERWALQVAWRAGFRKDHQAAASPAQWLNAAILRWPRRRPPRPGPEP